MKSLTNTKEYNSLLIEELKAKLQQMDDHNIDLKMQIHELQQNQTILQNKIEELNSFNNENTQLNKIDNRIYEHLNYSHVKINDKGIIFQANSNFSNLIEYKINKIRSTPITNYIHPTDQDTFYLFKNNIKNDSINSSCELKLKLKSNSIIWVLLLGIKIVDKYLNFNGIHIIFIDISEKKQKEFELECFKDTSEVVRNEKLLKILTINHDIKQPMFALSLYIDSLKQNISLDNQQLLYKIEKCYTQLDNLLNNASEIYSDKVVSFNLEQVNINQFIESMLPIYSEKAFNKKIDLRFYSSGNVNVLINKHSLIKVIGNLISNAVRYTNKGGVLVAIRKYQQKTWIEIWDTGIGIPRDKLNVIFEKYTQLINPFDVEYNAKINLDKGSGLGLFNVNKILKELNLTMRVKSRLGRGSMFAVELPV